MSASGHRPAVHRVYCGAALFHGFFIVTDMLSRNDQRQHPSGENLTLGARV
jgi:hypothetical protein